MATQLFTPIRGKRIRVTELDECGRVMPTSRKIVTNGFVTVTIAAEVEDGTETTLRRADGALCVSELDNPSLKYLTLEIEFCQVNPSLISFLTSAIEYSAFDDDIIGMEVPEGEISGRSSFEMWTGLAGGSCTNGGQAGGYFNLPHLRSGTLGDITVDGENAVTFTVTGAITHRLDAAARNLYPVLRDPDTGDPAIPPGPVDPLMHMQILFTELAPPPEAAQPSLYVPTPTP